MENVRYLPLSAVKASASRIVNLTKSDFSYMAKRFLRWRGRLPRRKIKRFWRGGKSV